ncbi:MAG: heterodisulfide reductase-related iron-sulfur binding cluster [Candidatus Bipolaricaulota bacterium]|nr:heterodisulfide reductase-related iron-sulfur binding cluster [Candidatus Bipolaricaulota bacterium]MDW8030579.1 4Fe-4S dicluster domain-containing protein [Candidatus Bipolaricaulota bacterium]
MATRKVFWNISSFGELIFYLIALIAIVIFAYGIYAHVRRILQGKKVAFTVRPFWAKLGAALVSIAANRTILRHDASAGVMHFLIMWGFVVLFIGTVIVTIEYDLFQKILGMKHGFWVGSFFLGYELILDTLGVLFLAGLIWALVRRYGLKPPQLTWKPLDLVLPVWLLLIGVTGFLVEGLRLAATASELTYDPRWSWAGFFVSQWVQGASVETLRSWHLALWWAHGILALGWIAYLPYAPKVMHILSAGVNLFFQEMRPRGRLEVLDVEGAFERNEVLGFQTLKDLTRKDFLDLASCTECGRCEANCPAHLSGKILSPREIILELRAHANEEFPAFGKPKEHKQIIGYSIKPEEIWACTTCMACVEVCPVFIDPLNKILELRRNEVMIQDKYPAGFTDVFKGMDGRGNPWDMPASERLAWMKGLDVPVAATIAASNPRPDFEYLFFVGCAASFDPRTQKIARSVVKILQHAGIKFAVLSEEEGCTGDPARRIGHEYIFQILAQQNIETLNNYNVKKILTICPHCFNTLKNEYPALGGQYEVIHHTELIAQLLRDGRLKLMKEIPATIVYHDSCYLGRYNRIFDAPRDILKKISGVKLIEMERHRERGMCCGAGGGLMWLEEEPGKRVNELRVKQAQEAFAQAQTNGRAKFVASACPFCMIMLEDGIKSKNAEFENKDIAELVAEALA